MAGVLAGIVVLILGWAFAFSHLSGDRASPPARQPASPGTGGPLHPLAGANACIKGPASPSWTRCSARAAGLQDARSIAISPDGRFAYAASEFSDAVAAFARNPRTGALRQLSGGRGCVKDLKAPSSTVCGQTAAGLQGPMTVALSPDGRNAYVASIDGDSIAVLARDRRTGALRPLPGGQGCVRDRAANGIPCTPVGVPLHGVRWPAVSPDGRNVYVAVPASDAIVSFARERVSGALRPLQGADACVKDIRQQDHNCPISVHGLNEPRMVAISPDGRNVYAAADLSYSVTAFSRDPATGGLRPLPGDAACIQDVKAGGFGDCPSKADGLNFAFSISLSHDGRFAYVASNAGDSVAAFSRDRDSGALHPLAGREACIRDIHSRLAGCVRTAVGLDGAVSVSISPDDRYAYVASFYGGAVAAFARDTATGALRQLPGRAACLDDPQAPSNPPTTKCPSHATGLEGPRDVAISPDGRNAYVPASVGANIALFSRVVRDSSRPSR